MKRLIFAVLAGMLTATPLAIGQTSTTTDTTDTTPALSERTPAENVRGDAVRARAPGNIISAARSRHTDTASSRLEYQRSGGTEGDFTASAAGSSSSGGSSSSTGNALIDSLLGSLGISDLSSLLGDTTGSTDPNSSGSELPQEVLDMLSDAGINIDDVPLDGAKALESTSDAKTGQRQQTTTPTDEEDPFRVRWADAMLSTLFTSLVFAFQTPDFIGTIEDLLRPVIRPDLSEADTGSAKSSSDSEIRADDAMAADRPLRTLLRKVFR